MDEVFRALAEPTRRSLLDELFERGRADAERARAAAADDALRRDEAPEGARGGRPGGDQAARPREAALPEPRPDPARPRPVGEQVRRALGRGAQRAQADTRRKDDGEGVRDLHQDDARSASGRRSPTPRCGAKYNFGVGVTSDWTPGSRYEAVAPRRADRDRRGREPRGRPAAPAGPELHRPLERRREERGDLAGHLGDRAGRRLVPADRHPRPAARGRQRRALRRLADDPLRPQDAARDRRVLTTPGSLMYSNAAAG